MNKKGYAYWLCGIPGIGNQTIMRLLANDRHPEEIFTASQKSLEECLRPGQLKALVESRAGGVEKLQEDYEKLKEHGIDFYWFREADYPKRLKNIPDPPFGVFVKGKLPEEGRLSVAVIGARDCSEYGRYVATELGRYLGEKGISLISGMARGIDGISQTAALESNGMSYGVLGCGVDICYPAQNKALYESLLKSGGILSEYVPGTLPKAQHFPPRNRIVSGLADALVVIEARNKSGTLITVDMALEQGKEVYVVPGRVTDRLSDGCNSLLKQGAEVFLSPEEFVRELREKSAVVVGEKRAGERLICEKLQVGEEGFDCEGALSGSDRLSVDAEKGVVAEGSSIYLQALDFYPKSLEEIAGQMSQPCALTTLNVELLKLCLEGRAQQVSAGYFCKKG